MNLDFVISLSSKEDNLDVGVSYDRTVVVYPDIITAVQQNCIFNRFYQIRVSIISNVIDKANITKISSFKVTKRFESYEISNLIDVLYGRIPELTDSIELELYFDYVDLLKNKLLIQLRNHEINISYDELTDYFMISDDDYCRWIELLRILRLMTEDMSKNYVMSKLLDFVIHNHADNIRSIKHDNDLDTAKLILEV